MRLKKNSVIEIACNCNCAVEIMWAVDSWYSENPMESKIYENVESLCIIYITLIY